MSDKLTEQKIEELIEQLLQEKINVQLTGKWEKKIDDLLGKDVKDNDVKYTAKADGDDESLTDDDFFRSFTTDGSGDPLVDKKGKITGKGKAYTTAKGVYNKSDTDGKKEIDKINAIAHPNKNSRKVKTSTFTQELGDAATDKERQAIYSPKDDNAFEIPKTKLPYFDVSQKEWTPGEELRAAGNIDKTTFEIFGAEVKKHGNLMSLFTHYQELSNDLKAASDKDQTAIEKIKNTDAATLFNSLSVIQTLEFITNTFQGASAGTIYETIIALMSSGVVFGGAAAAADILSGNKGKVLISAKNKQLDKTVKEPKGEQAISNFIGDALPIGETIWYVGLGKRGESENDFYNRNPDAEKYNTAGRNITLEIWIAGIVKIGGSGANPTDYRVVNAEGEQVADRVPFTSARNAKLKIPFQKTKKAATSITIASWGKAGEFQNISVIADAAIEAAQNAVQIAIKSIYTKLNSITTSTQRVVALKKSDDIPSASKQAAQVNIQYGQLKNSLQAGFTGLDSSIGSEIKESKMQSLDDLIAETIRDIKKNKK